MSYSLNITLTPDDRIMLRRLASELKREPTSTDYIRMADIVKHICNQCVRTNDVPVKTYVPQRLSAFRASLATLPPDTEVRLDSDGSPAGWTYSARDNAIYLHK